MKKFSKCMQASMKSHPAGGFGVKACMGTDHMGAISYAAGKLRLKGLHGQAQMSKQAVGLARRFCSVDSVRSKYMYVLVHKVV